MVHCSGGIGRSGAFTSILSVLYLLNKYVEVSLQLLITSGVFSKKIILVPKLISRVTIGPPPSYKNWD